MMKKPPLQNRVAPTGEIVSVPGRGLLMGNRDRAPIAVPAATSVELLTPPASVATIAAGYRALLHPSATARPISEG